MAEDALAVRPHDGTSLVRTEFGPIGRALCTRFFEPVRFSQAAVDELTQLEHGFVVHVMRTQGWLNYLYLDWALAHRGLKPIRAVAKQPSWFTRPFTLLSRHRDLTERFTAARQADGSGLLFLREAAFNTARGVEQKDDPFPALVEMARAAERPLYLVPELLVWEKWQQKVTPSLFDRIFGSPEAPTFIHSWGTFIRNYQRAQFRVGQPIDLTRFVAEHPELPTPILARKVRGALHQHLARETRAVFGPPRKDVDRLIHEAMRDRTFQESVRAIAQEKDHPVEVIQKEALRHFDAIAARFSPTVVGLFAPTLDLVFNRIYDGLEIDEAGLDRAMKAGAKAPVVLTPSHKSHIDYLLMSYALWQRGYTVPLVAAGANLSFFPLGSLLRRSGAFFLRRSFKGDALYTAVFKAYLKKLVHDGIPHEFFPEGGRSRTGKLLQPKLGLFTWLVEAVLEGARDDLLFVPVAIDYEKVVESASYAHELGGGEKKPEDLKSLLSAPRVLTENYGRIHVRFDEPVSLAMLMRERGLDPRQVNEEDKKALVRSLGHRVMYGISRVSTVTPHALLASALLSPRQPASSSTEIAGRIELLTRLARDLGAPLSRHLEGASSSPASAGPIAEAMRVFGSEGYVRTVEGPNDPVYQVEEEHRRALSFYKNTILNLVAGRTIVSAAMLAAEPTSALGLVREKALSLSRLFKFEFLYPVGKDFEHIFDETVQHLTSLGLVERRGDRLLVCADSTARAGVQFLAELIRDYLESYWLTARSAAEIPPSGAERKDFLRRTLDRGRSEFVTGTIVFAEALSKTNLENALQFLLDQGLLAERDKRLVPGQGSLVALVHEVRSFFPEAG